MRELLLGAALVAAGSLAGLTASVQDMFLSADDRSAVCGSDFIGYCIFATVTAITAGGIAGIQDTCEDLGEVNDSLLTCDGLVVAVLVDIGGFPRMGKRQVAICPGSLYFFDDSATGNDPNEFLQFMTAGRSVLKGAPIHDRALRGRRDCSQRTIDVCSFAECSDTTLTIALFEMTRSGRLVSVPD